MSEKRQSSMFCFDLTRTLEVFRLLKVKIIGHCWLGKPITSIYSKALGLGR